MTRTIPDDVCTKAEIYLGDTAGQEKTHHLLHETAILDWVLIAYSPATASEKGVC
jgi:hypothetical protein